MSSKYMTATIELIIFVAIALVLKELMDPLFWRYSGPASLITTLILLTSYMQVRGERWSSMGLIPLPRMKARLWVIPQAGFIFLTVLITVTLMTKGLDAIGLDFMSEPIAGEEERWGDVEGNLRLYLILIALSWVSAGFAEEMFFRGFVITKIQTALGGGKIATTASILLSALLFGYVHFYYQGLAGFVNAGVIGLIFATLFLLYKRNLWPLILAHGFINSLGFTAEYMGWAV